MFPDIDEQNFIPLDNQFKHYPVADVDGYRRQATQVSLEIVKTQRRMMGIQFEQLQGFTVLAANLTTLFGK